MARDTSRAFWPYVILLFLAHLAGDFYAMFCSPLLPELREQLKLSLKMTANLGTVYLIVQNYSQPLLGLAGEWLGRRRLMVAGIVLSALGMSVLCLAPSYWAALGLLTVGGLGVGLFHPCAASLVGDVTERRSMAMTIFMLGGSAGIMLPPLIVPVLAARDPRWVALLCIPGIILAAGLTVWLRQGRPQREVVRQDIWAGVRKGAGRLAWLHLRVVLRSIPLLLVMILLPLYCTIRGYSPAEAGRILSFALLMGAAGMLAGGWLSDRVSRRALMVVSEIGAGVFLLAAPMLDGRHFVFVMGGAVFLAFVATPMQILMAQEATPNLKGPAAAIVMGLAYGNASLALIPLNALGARLAARYGSELIGLSRELQVASLGFFLAAAIALGVEFGSRERVPVPVEDVS